MPNHFTLRKLLTIARMMSFYMILCDDTEIGKTMNNFLSTLKKSQNIKPYKILSDINGINKSIVNHQK